MKSMVLYVKQRKRGIFLFCLFTVIFFITFFLYDLPLSAVGYPTVICAVLGVLFFVWDFRRVKQKHDMLCRLKTLSALVMEPFPAQKTQKDADYQAIIKSLRQQYSETVTSMNLRYQDMIDYYTIWAHQIKTPIASMRLTLQNEDSTAAIQLSDDLQRIEQYVEMVLAFLRLDSDAKDYVFKEQDLDAIIRESVKKLANQFIRKKLRLCYTPLHTMVLTDEKWLSFVIEQVLSNALKYTACGQITIDMETPSTLCIRDTGIGIAPEDLPRVFEKSYTGYNGRTDKKASGIGLYLCKRICDNLGHRITIDSTLDSGTVVRIDLAHEQINVE